MEQNLDTKLTRIENTVNIMKTNLRLPENEVIEKVAEATNLHSLANIFMQEEEPEVKNGIWIQANEAEYKYDTIKIDKNIIIPGQWRPDLAKKVSWTNFYMFPGKYMCTIGDKLYIYNPSNGYLYSYNYETNSLTEIISVGKGMDAICSDNINRIFFCGSSTLWIVNIDTKEKAGWTCSYTSGSYNASWNDCCYNAYDNSVYMLGSNEVFFASFNLTNNSFKKIRQFGRHSQRNHIFARGHEIVFISGSDSGYNSNTGCIYDIDTGLVSTGTGDLSSYVVRGLFWSQEIGQYHYVFQVDSTSNGSPLTKVVKIDKETLTYEDITEQFVNENVSKYINIQFIAGNYYGFYGQSKNTSGAYTDMWCLPMETGEVQYDHNSIVIMQSPITIAPLQTALWTYPCLEGRMCQSFFDVYYYNKDTGFNFTFPTYYGDGEKWIKFKN